MKSSKRIIYSRIIFITGIALLSVLSVLFIYETYQEYASSSIVYNTKTTRLSLEKLFSGLKDREATILRTALMADHSAPDVAVPSDTIANHLGIIDSLVREDATQGIHFEKLKRLVNAQLARQEALMLNIKVDGYVHSALFKEETSTSLAEMDTLRKHIDRMQNISTSITRERSLDAQKHTIVATMMGVTVSIFSIIVFILAFYFIDQELKRSQEYLDETQMLNVKIGEINQELEDVNRNLHHVNAELEGKNFQLEKSARELSSFTHITSHDMQEPLRKIQFYISILEAEEKMNLSDEGKVYLEKIRKSVNRMRQLFLSMLDFSLTNTVDNKLEEVDLNEVLQQTLNTVKVYLRDTNSTVESDHLPKVKGIRYQLVQLFENIISNSIKFRKTEVLPEIQITSRIIDTRTNPIRGMKNNSKYYRIDFSDNGIGFEPQYAEKIFEIFQRLLPRTDAHGVGIGLAICRKIAENHGGMLVAEAQPNEGAVFSLYIPV